MGDKMRRLMGDMRSKLYQFMIGRNGADEFSRFLSWFILILLLFGIFVRIPLISWIALVLIVYMYWRVFSRDLDKRRQENQKYLNLRYKLAASWSKGRRQAAQRRDYRFYKCPVCKQKVRVPKGHGRIEITCPKCREKFVRKS